MIHTYIKTQDSAVMCRHAWPWCVFWLRKEFLTLIFRFFSSVFYFCFLLFFTLGHNWSLNRPFIWQSFYNLIEKPPNGTIPVVKMCPFCFI